VEEKKQVYMEFYKSLLVLNVLLLSAIASLLYKKEFYWVMVAVYWLAVLWILILLIGWHIVKLGEVDKKKEEKL
jgi:hypothetical protein